jgi:hypothetical protein
LLYAVAFIILDSTFLSALCLLLLGLTSSAALIAVYERVRRIDAAFSLWALLLGSVGALGTAVHGGYDLANRINQPAGGVPALPDAVDPRGLLTFGVTGLALAVVAWLIVRGDGSQFPRQIGYLGLVAALLLLTLYVSRLITLDTKNPVVVVSALLSGFLVSPGWYLWVGRELLRGRA